MKKCPHCKMLLQPGMFPASPKEKQYICRECKSKYDRTYRQKNKEIIREKRAEYYLKKRDYFLLKAKKHYYENQEAYLFHHREYGKKYRQQLKDIVVKHYGGKCNCCGENKMEFFAIDHINGGGNQERKRLGSKGSGSKFYRLIIKAGFPQKYRILCFNCNHSLGHYGYCPHKRRIKTEILNYAPSSNAA